MGIFSGDNYTGAYASELGNVTLESLMEDDSINVDAVSEDLEEYALDSVFTVHENYGNFMKALALNELNAMETTGEEFVYTEGVLSDMVTAIKNFLKKIWEKIQALFKRAIMMFDSFSKTDKDFVNKYRKQLTSAMGKNLDDFVFKGYVFTIVDSEVRAAIEACHVDTDKAGIKANSNTDFSKANDNYSDTVEEFRGTVLSKFSKGKAGKYDASEFAKELHAALRNGEEEKEELDKIEVNDMMTELQTSKDARKSLNEAFKDTKKTIDADLKAADQAFKTYSRKVPRKESDYQDHTYTDKDTNKDVTVKGKDFYDKAVAGDKQYSKAYAYFTKLMRDRKAIMIQVDSAVIAALKERSRQYKACLTKIVYYKPKEEGAYMESGNFVSGANFLSGIELK